MRNSALCMLIASALVLSPRVAAAQETAAAARPQTVIGGSALNSPQAAITGTIVTPMGQPIVNATVHARNLLTGQISASVKTTVSGDFAITNLPTGSYVLEIVDDVGQVIGTSPFIAAAAGATVTAAAITATSGALSAVSTVTGLAAALTTTAVESVKFAAAAAGVAGVVTPPAIPIASPSR